MIGDALGLSAVFAAAGLLGIAYYRSLPTTEALRARLPNRVTPAGVVGGTIVLATTILIFQFTDGRRTIFSILALIYNLLIFETLVLWLFRWIRLNTLAVLLAFLGTGLFAWLQFTVSSNHVYSLTFIIATIGAAAFLVRMQYLRLKFFSLVAILWMVYDILSTRFTYPAIYRPALEPHTSFFFPAVAVGQLTLGSGDFMFLSLFTLLLYREHGRRLALWHVALQALALLTASFLRPPSVIFPYLTVMTPIFLILNALARRTKNTTEENTYGVGTLTP